MAKEFDLIVMGAGIIGAACAVEASNRGLSVLLLEKSDFGGETSASSFKIIHGGLRYLQHFDFPRLIESYKEQQFVRRAAPNLVKPLPFLVPCYGFGMKGKMALRVACSVYESIAKSRNANVEPDLKLPNHQVLSKDEVLKIAPLLNSKNLSGGVVFYDCQMLNPDRLTLQVIKAAEKNGVVVRNYNEVIKIFTRKNGAENSIEEITVKDHFLGTEYKVKAKVYLNALGPWGNQIGRLLDDGTIASQVPEPIYSKGVQLVFPEIINKYALSVQGKGIDTASNISRGGRSFFLQPWNGHTLVGTTDSIYKGSPDNNKITLPEIKDFLKELYDAYPSETFKALYVKYAYGGLRTVDPTVLKKVEAGEDRNGMVNTSRDEEIIDHSKAIWAGVNNINNLFSSIGIKYTTFRSVAERTINLIQERNFVDIKFDKNYVSTAEKFYTLPQSIPSIEVLMGYCMENRFKAKREDLVRLNINYGSDSKTILEDAFSIAKQFNLSEETAINASKIKFACRFEYAKSLSDIVLRRLDCTSLGFPGHPIIEEISRFASEYLGWTDEKRKNEVEKITQRFTFEN